MIRLEEHANAVQKGLGVKTNKKPVRAVTEKQQELAKFAKSFVKENGRFPTLREMAENQGVTTNAIRNQLDALVTKGVIVKVMRSYKFS